MPGLHGRNIAGTAEKPDAATLCALQAAVRGPAIAKGDATPGAPTLEPYNQLFGHPAERPDGARQLSFIQFTLPSDGL